MGMLAWGQSRRSRRSRRSLLTSIALATGVGEDGPIRRRTPPQERSTKECIPRRGSVRGEIFSNQHKEMSFREEYLSLIQKHEIEYDEQYMWYWEGWYYHNDCFFRFVTRILQNLFEVCTLHRTCPGVASVFATRRRDWPQAKTHNRFAVLAMRVNSSIPFSFEILSRFDLRFRDIAKSSREANIDKVWWVW